MYSSPARRCLARQLLEERPRLLDLTHSHQLSSERTSGTVEESECEVLGAFDPDAAVEQETCRLDGAGFRMRDVCDRDRDELRVLEPLGELEGGPPVRERSRDVSLREVAEAPVGEESCRSPVVAGGLDECFVAQRHLHRGGSEVAPYELSEHIRPFRARLSCIPERLEDRDGAWVAA